MGLSEINEASEVIYENADDNANIIFGALVDPTMKEEISITVLACDFDEGVPLSMSSSSDDDFTDDDIEAPRDADFYKDRRRNTLSPLGPDATLEETRIAITRGFKKPGQPPKEERKGGFRRLLRKLMGKR
jgi:cell division protein FtsZ